MRIFQKTSLCALIVLMADGFNAKGQPQQPDFEDDVAHGASLTLEQEWERDVRAFHLNQQKMFGEGQEFMGRYLHWLTEEQREDGQESIERFVEIHGPPPTEPDGSEWTRRFATWYERAEGQPFHPMVYRYLSMQYSNSRLHQEFLDLYVDGVSRWPMHKNVAHDALKALFVAPDLGRKDEIDRLIAEIFQTYSAEDTVALYRYDVAYYQMEQNNHDAVREQGRLLRMLHAGSWADQQVTMMLAGLDNLSPGMMAPDFETVDLDNKTFRLSEYRGRVVVLDFWSTSCTPCLLAMPALRALDDAFDEESVVVIGLALDHGEPDEHFNNVLDTLHMTWRQSRLPGGWKAEIANRYAINAIPTVVLIDQEGRIVKRELSIDGYQETIALLLEQQE